MTKNVQKGINAEVMTRYDDIWNEYLNYPRSTKRFRNCQAHVVETPAYFVLVSYNTPVAAIYKFRDYYYGCNNVGYDFLRYVYGYTATSAQHIAKFFRDYGAQVILRWVGVGE